MPSISLFLSVKAVIPGVPLKALTRSPEQTPAVSGTRTRLPLRFFLGQPPHLPLRGYRALGPSGLDTTTVPQLSLVLGTSLQRGPEWSL